MITKITLVAELNALYGIIGMIYDSTFDANACETATSAIRHRAQALAQNAYVLGILDDEEATMWVHKFTA